VVKYDQAVVSKILERIESAAKERDLIVKDLIENCQFKELLKPYGR
jgi:hypothetical protein